MKKIITIILMVCFALSLVACGTDKETAQEKNSTSETPLTVVSDLADSEINTDESSEANKSDEHSNTESKTLVVYFSRTGNTAPIAEYVAEITNADLFEIVPSVPYTDADIKYSDDSCRANKEQADDSSRPEISGVVDGMENYDTVFIAFPIWWGKEPRIIDTFMEFYDLSGKTVIPFCTSASSGISTAESNLHNMTGDSATWLEGKRFEAGTSKEDVNAWIDGLEGLK